MDKLLANGHEVRAITRSPQSEKAQQVASKGAEVVKADFEDVDSLRAAMAGIDIVFLMGTPWLESPEAETRHGLNALKAIAATDGIKHVVYTSVSDADKATGVPHFESKFVVEQQLEQMDVPHTIIAPAAFMENLFSPWTIPALKEGTFSRALSDDRPLQLISVENIAGFAAHVIDNPEKFVGQRINLAGDALTGPETAKALSSALGTSITYRAQPLESLKEHNHEMWVMSKWFQEVGYSTDIEGLRQKYSEVGWLTVSDWLYRNQPALD